MKEIYQQTVEEVFERVKGSISGLTSEEVKSSREKCGWNELAEGKKKSIMQIFLEQYKDFLVLILIASAIISGILGDAESAAVIVIVITINAILGTVQTVKAEQSLQSLKKLSGPEAKVLRDGAVIQIPARELVIGDVIMLEAGDMIPADGRVIEMQVSRLMRVHSPERACQLRRVWRLYKQKFPLGIGKICCFQAAL